MLKRKFSALAAVASITVLGAGAPMLALPAISYAQDAGTSQTHRAVHNGTLTWGVKQSFRKYITGNIAQGYIEYNGRRVDGNTQYTFPATLSGMSSKDSGLIKFDGKVHFYGHDGILDLTLSNIRLLVNGSRAQVIVDAEGNEFIDTKTKGPRKVWKDTRLANVVLSAAPDFSAATVRLQGTSTLNNDPQALQVFGKTFYEAGAEMDPIDVQLQLRDEAGAAPSQSGISASTDRGQTRSNATEGPAALVGTINDTLIEVNGLMVNTDNVLTNAEKLFNRQASDAASATPSTATPGPSPIEGGQQFAAADVSPLADSGAPGGGGAPAILPMSTSKAPVGGTTVAASAKASGPGNVCADSAARGVQKANATWGVRQSFRNYIKGSIARGGWELSGVGDSNNAFQWSGNSGSVNTQSKSGSILFPGAIRFTGHDGILDTRFSNMEVQFSGNTGQLILNTKSNDPKGNPHDFGRVTIANLSFSELNISDNAVSGRANTSLTAAGAEAFGQFYPAGDSLDPISFVAQLGGSPNCADGQGNSNSGEATGQGGSADQAASLRNDSASTTESTDAGANGSVLDELHDIDSSSTSKGAGESQFQIKSAGEDGFSWEDNTIAQMLLILASFVTSGGVLTRFVLKN